MKIWSCEYLISQIYYQVTGIEYDYVPNTLVIVCSKLFELLEKAKALMLKFIHA
nr:MAG TPA: hypothetical protein [Caudoviricetes sp.]